MIARALAGLARPLHRLLLHFAPPSVRAEYRAEMGRTFDAMLDDATRRGSWAVLSLARPRITRHPAIAAIRGRCRGTHVIQHPSGAASVADRSIGPGHAVARSGGRRSPRPRSSRSPPARPRRRRCLRLWIRSSSRRCRIRMPIASSTVQEASPAASTRVSLIAPGRLEDWQRLNRSFTALSGAYSEAVTDTSVVDPERLDGRRVAPRYFTVFGADAIVGRTFTDAEEQFGGPGAAVISDAFWARRFQRDPQVIGRALDDRRPAVSRSSASCPRRSRAARSTCGCPRKSRPDCWPHATRDFFRASAG